MGVVALAAGVAAAGPLVELLLSTDHKVKYQLEHTCKYYTNTATRLIQTTEVH